MQNKGVPASPSGCSAEPEHSSAVSAVPVSIPNAVRRVAEALAARWLEMQSEGVEVGPGLWVEMASVALSAMRQPTEEMRDMAWVYLGSNLRAEEIYPYLIDAALDPSVVERTRERFESWRERTRA